MENKRLNLGVITLKDIITHCNKIESTTIQKRLLDVMSDPIILSLLNMYLLENSSKLSTKDKLNLFISEMGNDFPRWIQKNGYENL